MSVIFLFSGKQFEYIPQKREVFRVDYQKNLQSGQIFFVKNILSHNESFGSPFLPNVSLKIEVLRHGLKKKIIVFKYKAKKRSKVKKGFRARYTEIKILALEEKSF